jgi:hypothetical protein
MSEPSKIAETVGYKRPPSHTRFKPGKSGNPRGRPRRKVNMSESLNQALDDKIVLTGFGKTLTGMEAFVQSIVDRVLQGDAKGILPAISRQCPCRFGRYKFHASGEVRRNATEAVVLPTRGPNSQRNSRRPTNDEETGGP